VGARDRAGKVKAEEGVGRGLPEFRWVSPDAHAPRARGETPSGLLTAKWGPAVAYILSWSFLLTDVGTWALPSGLRHELVITGCCFSWAETTLTTPNQTTSK
jgi:hypothetical protein